MKKRLENVLTKGLAYYIDTERVKKVFLLQPQFLSLISDCMKYSDLLL